MFEQALNIKVRKVDPRKQMQRTHPFYIWQVLMRFRTTDKLAGQEGKYRSPKEIARQLFSNFDELSEIQQDLVISAKLEYPMLCLRTSRLIEERTEKVPNPDYREYTRDYFDPTPKEIDRGVGEYRARPGTWGDWSFYTPEERYQATANDIDKSWRLYTGQPSRFDRADRWLKKRGII